MVVYDEFGDGTGCGAVRREDGFGRGNGDVVGV